MANPRETVRLEKITLCLEGLGSLLREGQIPCSPIHKGARHSDHTSCYVLGIDATEMTMCTDGGQGHYFYMDEQGRLHKQRFTQGEERHEWGRDEIVTRDYFLEYIQTLPRKKMNWSYNNMSHPIEVVHRLSPILRRLKHIPK